MNTPAELLEQVVSAAKALRYYSDTVLSDSEIVEHLNDVLAGLDETHTIAEEIEGERK